MSIMTSISRLSDKIFSNGLSTKYSYNDMGMLSELTHSDKDGILDKYFYTYDSRINKTCIEKYRRGLEEESGNYQYTYDELSRLTGVSKDDKHIRTYGYDEYGNRSYMIDKGIRTDYTYNPLNQLLRLDNTKYRQVFNYDARGNLTQVKENGRLKNSYEFSPLNRLTRAVSYAGQIADFEYSGLGHRVGKQISDDLNPTKNIRYTLDLTKQYHNLLQMVEDGQTKNYTWDFNVVSENNGGDNRFYMHDELGSPLRFADVEGALVDSYAYDEFGNDLSGNQGGAQPFGFTGYQKDNISDFLYAQKRYYNPYSARFISEDPIRSGGNWYGYCSNNPLSFLDPTGLSDECSDNDFIGGTIYNPWGELYFNGQIHNAVVRYMAFRHGLVPNLYANPFNHYDLFNPLTREVWEVKPISYFSNASNHQDLLDQLTRYLADGNIAGHPLGKDVMYYGGYTVNIYSLVPGEVYYTFSRPPDPRVDHVTVPVPEKEKEPVTNFAPITSPVPATSPAWWQWGLAGLIVVATLAEDVLTLGAGAADDAASFAAAAAILAF